MNPIVEIENHICDDFLIDNDARRRTIMSAKTLFDVKYENLKDTFIIENDNKVYSFLKDHENAFDLLEEVKPSLIQHFSDEKYYLEVCCWPEIYQKELTVIIKVDYSKEDIQELNKRLMSVKLETNAYAIGLGLLEKFYIMMECI